MALALRLKVLLPSEVLLDAAVTEVIAEAENGPLCLLLRHIDFVAALVPGLLSFETEDGREEFLAVDEGVLVKCGLQVLVSTRQAVRGPSLDILRQAIGGGGHRGSPPGLQFIVPYAAMTMGDYFMRQGCDVLVVFDDLTRHVRAYRELSLLLRRPPGREAYPGDIFYIHARLLERSTHLRQELGAGSLTALPIVETEAQNIAAYIPTNLISITDGQVYLSRSVPKRRIARRGRG